ncbi:MAG: molybdenum cofactor biosynthesis protein MoaE [Candidatus Sulfopaludibacter sp.]|nr:molybdenum cofactor biosynthesis protein MoaE [Candidatus Sulfopaludibacter sp.]
MHARVLFFGMLKEVVGRSAEDAEFVEGTDLRHVFETYATQYPRLREISRSIVVARNQEFAELAAKVEEGDEIAFLPPVSGGAGRELPEIVIGGNHYALTRHAIDTRALIARLLTGSEGAVVTFEGTVRNNTKGRPTLYLDYECYESMALKTMAKLGQEIAAGHPVERVAMVHRLGRMLVGETSVAVIVTAEHRRAAFEAALDGIDRLKKLVPIWKKEHFVDGEVWVEGEWDEHVPLAQ